MRTKIQVLSVENKSGRAKTGNDYNMNICQCIVHEIDQVTGGEKQLIGELVLPKNHPVVSPGMYEAEFGISVGQDKRIGGRLVQLFPVSAVQRPAAPVAPSLQKPA
jgi:hypothetical protein